MQQIEPCRVCGSPVVIVIKRGARRLGGDGALSEVRECTNLECPTNNTSIRRAGDTP